MDILFELSRRFLLQATHEYERYIMHKDFWQHRGVIIVGARGVGKTTALLQYLLKQVSGDCYSKEILYLPVDHFLMNKHSLYDVADQFQARGGRWLCFDEIHKYSNWSQEIKSIYDTFPQLFITLSGSSALEIYKGSHDISRRMVSITMLGTSFREYLEMRTQQSLPIFTLTEILHEHPKAAQQVLSNLKNKNWKVLSLFDEYLRCGYYPYFYDLPNEALFWVTVEQNTRTTIESDLVQLYPSLTGTSINKLKKLLSFIAQSVPFKPDIKKLKSIVGIGDDRTLKNYLAYLESAGLIRLLGPSGHRLDNLSKPEKIYLDNPNQAFAIGDSEQQSRGTLRETFFLASVGAQHVVASSKSSDFWVDEKYTFEVGGRNKATHQIKGSKNAYLALDDIESGSGIRIPLWLFGMMY